MRRALPDDELVEVRVLLEADERAHAVARELGRRGDDLVDDARLLLPRRAPPKNARAPTRMRPRRMSFWKTTTTMRMIDESSVESRLKSVTKPAHFDDDVDEEDDAEARCPSASRACRAGRAARGRRRT